MTTSSETQSRADAPSTAESQSMPDSGSGCTSGIGFAALDARTTGRTPGESTRGGVHCVVPAPLATAWW